MFLLKLFVTRLAIFADDDFIDIFVLLWLWIVYWLEAAHAVYCSFTGHGDNRFCYVIVVILLLLLSNLSFIATLLY